MEPQSRIAVFKCSVHTAKFELPVDQFSIGGHKFLMFLDADCMIENGHDVQPTIVTFFNLSEYVTAVSRMTLRKSFTYGII